jgi:ring-1,2-phenylacetyl-CoA epoxidase subunit PaaB
MTDPITKLEPGLNRWEVFKQDAPGKPHQAVGSVHASDAEHALFTARTVFVRRPNAHSLWVVPENDHQTEYLIFTKTNNRRSMTFVNFAMTITATSAQNALRMALEQTTETVLVWWVIPAHAITKSETDQETLESWFEPAKNKVYRQQSHYGVVGSHASKHNPKSRNNDDKSNDER